MNKTFIYLDNNTHYILYYSQDKIIMDKYINDKLIDNEEIINNVSSNFFISVNDKNEIYIFCQDLDGNILLIKKTNEEWQVQTILQNNNLEKININFSGYFLDKRFFIFYTNKNDKHKTYDLITQHLYEDDTWSEPEIITTDLLCDTLSYKLQKIDDNEHLILYKSLNNNGFDIGYKKIIDFNIKDYKSLLNTKNKIIDYSFLATKEDVHFVYIVKGLFSYQLIYCKRSSSNNNVFSKKLFEGQFIKSPIISIINNKLHISFINNDNINYFVSKNNGYNFTPVIKFNKFYENIEKLDYISMGKNNFICNQIYSVKNGSNIIFLNELYKESLKSNNSVKNNLKDINILNETLKENETRIYEYEKIIEDNNKKYETYIKEVEEQFKLLENKNIALLEEIKFLKANIRNE